MQILVADLLPDRALSALAASFSLAYHPEARDGELVRRLAETRPNILIVRSTRLRAEHFEAAPELALIVRAGAGTNTIDVAEASRRGIYVANCPGKNADAVAELAFAHILSLDRHIVAAANDLRAGRWNKKRYGKAMGLMGRTLGLIGLGRIGRAMIPRAHGFGLHVVAWSRSLTPDQADALGVTYAASPTEVARCADILSVHVAATEETRNLIDREVLEALPEGALFINTSRGDVVDERALEAALAGGRLRAAGLDVFKGEPTASQATIDPGLFALDNVQGSHHVGASTQQAQEAVAEEALRVVRTFAAGGGVPNCVNLARRSPATHLLTLRHRDRVGVLARALDVLRREGINIGEMENRLFQGGEAASARLFLSRPPSETAFEALRSDDDILAASCTALS